MGNALKIFQLCWIVSLAACQGGLLRLEEGMPEDSEVGTTEVSNSPKGLKKRVEVLPLWNDTNLPSDRLGEFVTSEIKRFLERSQEVLIEDLSTEKVTTEQFIQGDQIKVAQLIRYGRRKGVSLIVLGRVTDPVFQQKGGDVGILRQEKSMAAATVELKLFDVAGGKELLGLSNVGKTASSTPLLFGDQSHKGLGFRVELIRQAAFDAVPDLVREILKASEKLSWEGRVVKVTGQKIFLNSGRSSGLQPGDILKVMAEGVEIYDPETQAYLGTSEGSLKGTLEVLEFIGDDAAVARLHSGGNVRPGDQVKLY